MPRCVVTQQGGIFERHAAFTVEPSSEVACNRETRHDHDGEDDPGKDIDEDDAGKAQAAVDAVELVHPDDVRGNLTLPASGLHGTTFTWASGDPAVVTATGEVTRPAHGSDPVDVVDNPPKEASK